MITYTLAQLGLKYANPDPNNVLVPASKYKAGAAMRCILLFLMAGPLVADAQEEETPKLLNPKRGGKIEAGRGWI